YRGATSIAEHRELMDLLLRGAPPTEIEAVARAHKLATVEAFRAWRREQYPDGAPSSVPPRGPR
ncbi:MAG TPA: hypothetical protein VNT22_10780, partial [Baekduia sp.]|nr:hypothetical protein [Baekduia sp.]